MIQIKPASPPITKQLLDGAYTYSQHKQRIETLLEQGLHTGPEQNEAYLQYTKLNLQRMNKWDKIGQLSADILDHLRRLERPVYWLAITEGWCGDAAQTLPFVAKMAEVNPLISLRVIFRDEHPTVMDQYLSQGARSIPKIVWLTDTLEEVAVWGSKPQEAMKLVAELKKEGSLSSQEISTQLHTWYALNKGAGIQKEFEKLCELLT
jgi:hypothetical protein